jgi:hypothetical protein
MNELKDRADREATQIVDRFFVPQDDSRVTFQALKEDIAAAIFAAEQRSRKETSTCPCNLIEPCSYACSCAEPYMSGGCVRCAGYGSEKQRLAQAHHIAQKLDEK